MLKFINKNYRASTMLDEAVVPALGKSINVQNTQKSFIEDYQGLFIGYGKRETCYPYREQNRYTQVADKECRVAILENDYLYAEFLVDLGGRLWKLYNKKTGKDLLYTNDVIRFRNLSLRNAWFSGGVEWNIGVIGHTSYTCDTMYTAKVVGKNGEEVLRFYEFERVREVYYQIDFWLVDDKLMVRPKIYNTSEEVVPMYWWSNIATPEFKNGRLVVDADSAFNNSDGRGIKKSTIPVTEGVDVSFYENIMDTIDYFFDIDNRANKFIVNTDSEGNGLLQISSDRLKGRKLFSWGHLQGSRHWQDVLTDKAGDYVEIQAGLGKTQYECLPMPPKTSWEWVEVYTDIKLNSQMVAGDYKALVNEVNNQVAGKICTATLDEVCSNTLDSIALVEGEIVIKGTGFGYVKNFVENNAPTHLKFMPCEKSNKYLSLVKTGECSSDINEQTAFATEKYQIKALEDAINKDSDNWNIYYQLAVYKAYCKDYDSARKLCMQSMAYDNNYLNNHLMTFICRALNKPCKHFARKAIEQCPFNYSVAESILKLFADENDYEEVKEMYHLLNDNIKSEHRLKMYLAISLLNTGDVDGAEKLLESDGGLDIFDYREGDKMLDKLYKGIRVNKYNEKEENVQVPMRYDFIVAK